MLTWFSKQQDFVRATSSVERYRMRAESGIARRTQLDGYCLSCEADVTFKVDAGPHYLEQINLREGLVCSRCGLSNRARLLYEAILDQVGDDFGVAGAVLESTTPLFRKLSTRWPKLIGSEYLGPAHAGGSTHQWQGRTVRHESITNLSFADASLTLLAHSDVLEHVHDFRGALRETVRVLMPGGAGVFCVPFFMSRHTEAELARPRSDGSIEHFVPPEYHGDGLRPDGILTYYHFGWNLLEDMRNAGFKRAEIGMHYDLHLGFASNNHPNFDYGLMYPVLFRGIR